LGYCAARYVLSGGHAAMVSMQGGRFVPVPFEKMMDRETGHTRVRCIDVNSARYGIARRYMIRVRRDDFGNPAELERLAKATNLSIEDFRRRFEPLTKSEPPQLDIGTEGDAGG
jgi:6-phosphofructokinase 1